MNHEKEQSDFTLKKNREKSSTYDSFFEYALNTPQNLMNCFKLKNSQKEKAIAVVSESFSEDKFIFEHFFSSDVNYQSKIQELFKFKINSKFDKCYVDNTSDVKAVAIWDSPCQSVNNFELKEIWYGFSLPFKLGITPFLKMMEFQKLSVESRRKLIKGPYWYLDLICVQPDFQRQHIGEKLILPFLDKAKSDEVPVVLETQNSENVKYYERFGFKVISEELVGRSNFKNFIMLKKPL